MNKLFKKQEELINLLRDQLNQLSIMYEIKFEDDVIAEVTRLKFEIEEEKKSYIEEG